MSKILERVNILIARRRQLLMELNDLDRTLRGLSKKYQLQIILNGEGSNGNNSTREST